MKYLFYIPSIIGLLVCSCHAGEEQNQAENSPTPDNEFVEFTAMQYEAAGIRLGKAENKNLKQVVRASGYLEVPPQNEAKVAPMIGGIVKDIYVLEGNFVKKGQSLARIEHPDIIRLQEDYITAIANLGYLEKEYERQEALHEENVSAAKVFEQTEADYLTAHGRAKALAIHR